MHLLSAYVILQILYLALYIEEIHLFNINNVGEFKEPSKIFCLLYLSLHLVSYFLTDGI